MNILSISNILLTLLPVISDTVKKVEALHATPGGGKEKLALVLSLVKAIYEASSPVEPFDSIVGKVTEIVAALVSFYNSLGAFVKGVKAA